MTHVLASADYNFLMDSSKRERAPAVSRRATPSHVVATSVLNRIRRLLPCLPPARLSSTKAFTALVPSRRTALCAAAAGRGRPSSTLVTCLVGGHVPNGGAPPRGRRHQSDRHRRRPRAATVAVTAVPTARRRLLPPTTGGGHPGGEGKPTRRPRRGHSRRLPARCRRRRRRPCMGDLCRVLMGGARRCAWSAGG